MPLLRSSQFLSRVSSSKKDARPYQEDLWARPRPLPMAGGEARAEDEEQGQALRPQEVLLGARQVHRWLPGGLPGVPGRC